MTIKNLDFHAGTIPQGKCVGELVFGPQVLHGRNGMHRSAEKQLLIDTYRKYFMLDEQEAELGTRGGLPSKENGGMQAKCGLCGAHKRNQKFSVPLRKIAGSPDQVDILYNNSTITIPLYERLDVSTVVADQMLDQENYFKFREEMERKEANNKRRLAWIDILEAVLKPWHTDKNWLNLKTAILTGPAEVDGGVYKFLERLAYRSEGERIPILMGGSAMYAPPARAEYDYKATNARERASTHLGFIRDNKMTPSVPFYIACYLLDVPFASKEERTKMEAHISIERRAENPYIWVTAQEFREMQSVLTTGGSLSGLWYCL